MVTSGNGYYEPDIHINENLMETLTLDEKREWVESCPTKVFKINPDTQQKIVKLKYQSILSRYLCKEV